jgi:hypothetical protein
LDLGVSSHKKPPKCRDEPETMDKEWFWEKPFHTSESQFSLLLQGFLGLQQLFLKK